jgi:hypothetical protein
MKPLIPTDSPLYLRRLVRELNDQPDGFYVADKEAGKVKRCSRARLRLGRLVQVREIGGGWFFIPTNSSICNPCGSEIIASRRPS